MAFVLGRNRSRFALRQYLVMEAYGGINLDRERFNSEADPNIFAQQGFDGN